MNNNVTQRGSLGRWVAIGAGIGAALMSAGLGPAALAGGLALGVVFGAIASSRGSGA